MINRFLLLILVTVSLLIAVLLLAPHLASVTLYKVFLISLAALLGYWFDRVLFPYARPDGYLMTGCWDAKPVDGISGAADYQIAAGYQMAFVGAQIRRVLIVGLAMLAMGMAA